MATEAITRKRSYTAGTDLSAAQYHAVYLSGNKTVALCRGDVNYPIGILQNAPTAGQAAEVVVGGVSPGVLGETVTAGARLQPSGTGTFVIVTPGHGYCAIAEEGGAAGATVSIMFLQGAVIAAPLSP